RAADEIDVRVQPDDPQLKRLVVDHLRANPWQCQDACVALDLGEQRGRRRVAIVQGSGYRVITFGGEGAGVEEPEVAAAALPIRDGSLVEIREVPTRYIVVTAMPVGPRLDALEGGAPPRYRRAHGSHPRIRGEDRLAGAHPDGRGRARPDGA